MAKKVWHAAESNSCVDSQGLRRARARRTLCSLMCVLLALLLVSCGTGRLPQGILPSEDGNFTLRFNPADAEVIVTEEGFETAAITARYTGSGGEGEGVLRYQLKPGRYKVIITREGYLPVEKVVEIAEAEEDDTAAGVGADLEIELEPDSEEPAAPDDTDPDGSTDGGDYADDDSGSAPVDDGGAVVSPRGFDMLGDPQFDLASLTDDQRLWYERMWAATRNPDSSLDPDRMAASDDSYVYSRDLHNHLQTLLIVFRATGDLKLLDEVDRLAEIMRSKLQDAWTGTLDGTDGTTDGYLGWAFRTGSYPEFEGKDNHETNEVKTHAIVASFAYALELNRDLTSPSGRDYGAHADFWKTYLVDHFEAKWRKRKRKSSGFPVLMRPHTHTYLSGLKYHYYMFKLTGVQGYLDEAERNSRVLWDNEIKTTTVGSGSGYVWARSVLSEGGGENYLHPTTYARYVYADAIELYFEGFDSWGIPENMPLLANPVAEWVLDREGAQDGWDWFARDIGGGMSRAGIPSESKWKRLNTLGFSWTPYTLLAPWDSSGRIAATSVEVLRELGKLNTPGAIYIPAGMFLDEWMSAH